MVEDGRLSLSLEILVPIFRRGIGNHYFFREKVKSFLNDDNATMNGIKRYYYYHNAEQTR